MTKKVKTTKTSSKTTTPQTTEPAAMPTPEEPVVSLEIPSPSFSDSFRLAHTTYK